jgi:hypothetical protein
VLRCDNRALIRSRLNLSRQDPAIEGAALRSLIFRSEFKYQEEKLLFYVQQQPDKRAQRANRHQ